MADLKKDMSALSFPILVILFLAIVMFCFTCPAWNLMGTARGEATSVVTTDSEIKAYQYVWLASAAGTWDSGTSDYVTGYLIAVKFQENATYTPTDKYDVAATDSEGANFLKDVGTDIGTATSRFGDPGGRTPMTIDKTLIPFANEPIGVKVTNAGANSRGIVILYFKK